MSKNVQTSSLQREDWFVLLTWGLVSSGTIGWLVHKGFLSYEPRKAIAVSFAGGMGIYFLGSALFYMYRKFTNCQRKSISEKDASDLTAQNGEVSIRERFSSIVNELDREFALEASKAWDCKDLDKKTSMNNIHEAAEAPCKSEDVTKKLHDFNQHGRRNGIKLPVDNTIESCRNEDIGSRKSQFIEEILSWINELEGYVRGTFDPLSSARNIQFPPIEMSDEMRLQVVLTIKEYARSILPKLEQSVDEFAHAVCQFSKVLDDEKGYESKKAFETRGVSEKDSSIAPLMVEMNQHYKTLKNTTKRKSQMSSCQNSKRCKDALGNNIPTPESLSNLSLDGKNFTAKTPELSLPVKTKLNLSTTTSASLKNSQMNPSMKLFLNQEQIGFLNMLKSEL